MFKTIIAAVLLRRLARSPSPAQAWSAWFTYDDLMNLYAAARTSLSATAAGRQRVFVWRGVARPFADLLNHARLVGLRFPSGALPLALFPADSSSISASPQRCSRRLSQSAAVDAAGRAAVLPSSRTCPISTTTPARIYDLLCFLFFFAAVLWYTLAARWTRRVPTWTADRRPSPRWRWLAMNSKEMAIALPVHARCRASGSTATAARWRGVVGRVRRSSVRSWPGASWPIRALQANQAYQLRSSAWDVFWAALGALPAHAACTSRANGVDSAAGTLVPGRLRGRG